MRRIIFLFVLLFVAAEASDSSTDGGATCPTRREEVDRRCGKACAEESDCKGKRKRCLCDGHCGMSCVNPNLKCPKLSTPIDGSVTYGVVGAGERKFGAGASFDCGAGFRLRGAREKVCGNGGEWWPSEEPECLEVSSWKTEGSRDDSPSQAEPTRRRPRHCGHPGKVANAKLLGKKFEFPAIVEFVCKSGFRVQAPEGMSNAPKYLSKLGKMRCRKDGKWAGIKPVCKSIQCDHLPKLRHGSTIGGETSIGAKVRFSCNFSYRLIGPSELTCGNDGKWSGDGLMPKCQEIDCKSPGILHNGYIEGDRTTLESVIVFQCVEGAQFDGGSDRAICREDGTWSHPLPKCWQSCVAPELADGSILDHPPGRRIPHAHSVTFACAEGHVIQNATTATCVNGTLSALPVCAPAPCTERPPWIRKGRVVFHNHDHGSKARYECDSGFALNVEANRAELTCQFGKWVGTKPACEAKYCPFPGYIENGHIFLVGNLGEYDYRPYIPNVGEKRKIRYDCNKNFKLKGPNAATCVDGDWSPEMKPTCVPGKHPDLERDLRGRRSVERLEGSSCAKPLRGDVMMLHPWISADAADAANSADSVVVDASPNFRRASSSSSSSSSSLPHGSLITVSCSFDVNNVISKCEDGRWIPSPIDCAPS